MIVGPYWPAWLGAATLALVTVGCCVVARRPLGVSGILGRFVALRAELRAERQRRALDANAAAAEAAMMAETLAAFGPEAVAALRAAADQTPPAAAGARAGCTRCTGPEARPSLGAHAVFLVAMVLGGALAQLSRGGWALTGMGASFEALFGRGPGAALALLGGGVLVGLGTALSGGCSTGHGLSGCSRLQPAGVAATATFVGTAVLVSLALARGLA